MRDYTKIEVWKKAHQMVLHVYQHIFPALPSDEKYDLHKDLKYITDAQYIEINQKINEVKAMLIGFIKVLRK